MPEAGRAGDAPCRDDAHDLERSPWFRTQGDRAGTNSICVRSGEYGSFERGNYYHNGRMMGPDYTEDPLKSQRKPGNLGYQEP